MLADGTAPPEMVAAAAAAAAESAAEQAAAAALSLPQQAVLSAEGLSPLQQQQAAQQAADPRAGGRMPVGFAVKHGRRQPVYADDPSSSKARRIGVSMGSNYFPNDIVVV